MNNLYSLRESTALQEGSLKVSKFLKIPFLLESFEMGAFFDYVENEIGPLFLFPVQGVVSKNSLPLPKESFLEAYQGYVEELKKGCEPNIAFYAPFFSLIATTDLSLLYIINVGEGQCIVKATLPIIQIQMHSIHYSFENGAFQSMLYGKENICWGLQFSYPQLFQENKTQEIIPVIDSTLYPNTKVFKAMQRWVRMYTSATSLIVDEKVSNEPFRLGKGCREWINNHPGLKRYNIQAKVPYENSSKAS